MSETIIPSPNAFGASAGAGGTTGGAFGSGIVATLSAGYIDMTTSLSDEKILLLSVVLSVVFAGVGAGSVVTFSIVRWMTLFIV